MPATSMLFLLASVAICGLPPFNGFISEFLIYKGFFSGLDKNIFISLLFLGGIMGLTVTGGLAVFCFTKAFGVVFLGAARTNKTDHAHEVPSSMLLPKFLIAIPIVAIGMGSFALMPFIEGIAVMYLPAGVVAPVNMVSPILQPLSVALGLFILLLIVLYVWRAFQQKRVVITAGPTWGCGYSGLTPEHQYTSTTFADNLKNLSMSLSGIKTHYHPIDSEDIFPAGKRKYETHQVDRLEKILILNPSKLLLTLMLKFTFLRSGKIQHYILYGLGFILIVALLTIVNAI
jgi:NADH:ubiquinone oxidoreductase subunit 5 (subunit L)/multisubunit Na+/H+ antiporter MnhA subunit